MRRFKKSIIYILTIIIIIAAHYTGITKPLENTAVFISKPALGWLYDKFGTYEPVNKGKEKKTKAELEKENKKLERRLNDIIMGNAKCLLIKEENARLEKELNFDVTRNEKIITAKVIGKDINTPGSLLLINKGSKQGVVIGATAASEGIVVGSVIKTTDQIAWVRLFSHQESKVAASIVGKKGAVGVLKGGIETGLVMELIPQNIKIEENDVVASSSLDETIIPDLIIGKVSGIQLNEDGLFQEIYVRPFVDYRTIREMSIMLPAGVKQYDN